MADQKEATITLERNYIIPLRKEFQKAPQYKRARKAVTAVRGFLMKHMKGTEVKVGRYLNLSLWQRGIKRPPHKVSVVATKYSDGVVVAELAGAPEKPVVQSDKKEEEKEDSKKSVPVQTETAAQSENKPAGAVPSAAEASPVSPKATPDETAQQQPVQEKSATKTPVPSPKAEASEKVEKTKSDALNSSETSPETASESEKATVESPTADEKNTKTKKQ